MSEGAVASAVDPLRALRVVERSPAAVRARDRAGWLALFTDDAAIEDPVGAGAHVGAAARARFWDVFIAPQRSVTFEPRREFVRGDHVVRDVEIATVTPVSAEPFRLRAFVEYRVVGDRVASLRAYWEPSEAVRWHAQQGISGLWGLTRHGLRTTTGLGLGAATRFGLAMRPALSEADAARIAGEIGRAHGGDRAAWRALAEGADLAIETEDGGLASEVDRAFDGALRGSAPRTPDVLIRAGDWLATVLVAPGGAAPVAALARVEAGRVRQLRLLREG